MSYFLIRDHSEVLTELPEALELRLPLLVGFALSIVLETKARAMPYPWLVFDRGVIGMSPYVQNTGRSLAKTVNFILPFV